jgi:hypothetical protein
MWYRKKKEGNTGLFFEIELIFISYLGEICSDREVILGNALLQLVRKFGVQSQRLLYVSRFFCVRCRVILMSINTRVTLQKHEYGFSENKNVSS